MTRISLKEAYDNKDVIAQIYAIRDTAESAVDTSEQAVTTANTASEHVDALVPQVEGAVENANSASASAQASAQTVAGYENRLTVAEGAIEELESDVGSVGSDLTDVTLRVTTAEGQIVTIQGRVTALETADGQNVKLTTNQNITGIKTVPLETTGVYSNQIASSQKIRNEIDNYCLKLTDNQVFSGIKRTNTGAFIAGAMGEDRRFVYIADNLDVTSPPETNTGTGKFCWRDKNDVLLGDIGLAYLTNGTTTIFLRVRNSDGTIKNVTIATGDVI